MTNHYDPSTQPANLLRRKELACDDTWIQEFLTKTRFGYFATRWDEQPFLTPTNFWYDRELHSIFFHSNISGRLRANIERHPQAAFSASEAGRVLPANTALEFSIQYESVIAFGQIHLLKSREEKLHGLYGLIGKYFPQMEAGVHYRPVLPAELKRTAVYQFVIESWSGKRNWAEQALQSAEWAQLPDDWLKGWL